MDRERERWRRKVRREKIRYTHIPAPLRGVGMAFILTGLMGLAFLGFMGFEFEN